jgi:hypothetical protein
VTGDNGLTILHYTTQDETQPMESVGSPFGLRLIKLEFGWVLSQPPTDLTSGSSGR